MNLNVETRMAGKRTGVKSSFPLLTTKILPPRIPPESIERPRLFALLPLVRAKQPTVIKAPAGFGKTSLAVAWAERLRGLVGFRANRVAESHPTRTFSAVSQIRRGSKDIAANIVSTTTAPKAAAPGPATMVARPRRWTNATSMVTA
jgi:hypothetical protein